MCGIAGYLSTSQEVDPRLTVAAALLGLHMRERGKHSWGITDGHEIKKYRGDIMESYAGQFTGSRELLLHTRHATTGAQTEENSHPFLIDGAIGVHNGMMYNHKEIAEKYNITYQVDSEVLLNRIINYGDISEIEAYGAVVFFQEGILHIGKFNGGQMSLAKTDFGWMWASTADALKTSLRMSGLMGTAQYEVKLKEGRLYKLVGDTLAKDRNRRLNVKVKSYDVSATSTPYKYGTSHGHGVWSSNSQSYSIPERDYSKYRGRVFDSTRRQWQDPEGYWYDRYDDDAPAKPLQLPTASTTTFSKPKGFSVGSTTTSVTDEPESDYDDTVVVTEPEADLSETDAATLFNYCEFCKKDLGEGTEFVDLKPGKSCKKCYVAYQEEFSEVVDGYKTEYSFTKHTADVVYGTLGDSDLIQCSDCQDWSMGDDEVYVETSKKWAVCSACYKRNYDFENDEDGVGTATAPPTGETCPTHEREVGFAPRFCMRSKGHSGACFDSHGTVFEDSSVLVN